MNLLPIKLPEGIFRNGTPYEAKGRWYDGNLIRWHDNAMRPIGGWQRRQSPSGDIPALTLTPATVTFRDVITYRDNAGLKHALFGSNETLIALSGAGLLTDVTPAGHVTGLNVSTLQVGYGVGPYGVESYGTARDAAGVEPTPVPRWSFSMWGSVAIVASVNNGPVYSYTTGDPAALSIVNAPTDVADVLVTDNRILMVLKNGPTDIREVIWSDQEDYTVWAEAIDNYAGSYRLQGTGNLIGAYSIQGDILILSETDAHIGRFLGAPFVYGFERVGDNCAPLSKNAVVSLEKAVIWAGNRNFWIYDGTLNVLPCEVIDYFVETIDYNKNSKLHTTTVSEFGEVWWFYQSISSPDNEVDSYISYDHLQKHWSIGKLSRTCAVDRGAYSTPIMVDSSGIIWNHEKDKIMTADPAYAITGPLELGAGGSNMAVSRVFVDTERSGAVQLSFLTRQFPTAPETTHGPYPIANHIPVSGVLGREVRIRVDGVLTGWEFGTPRLEVVTEGAGSR